ncbi:MAG: sensor histidine kinase [Prochlorococcaceae cyanobacterium]
MKRLLPERLAARLVLFSAVQLLLVGIATGLFGYANGRREGLQRLSFERQQHKLTELSEALAARLQAPLTINRDNMLAIRQGSLQLGNFDELGQRFWRQMQLYPVGYINWGSAQGSFLGVERLESGQLVLNEDSERPLGRGKLGVYALGANGARGRLLEVVPGMDTFHKEAWYADTIKANRATWSSIYQWEDKPHVFAISYNEPVRDRAGRLLGVIGVDFVLSQLSTWLAELWQTQPGLALVVEPSGLIVASSKAELKLTTAAERPARARIDQLADPLAKAVSRQLFVPQGQQLRPHQAVIAPQRNKPWFALEVDGTAYTIEAVPWGRAQGLNWILITALSEDQALLQSRQQSAIALALGVLALGGVLLLNRQLISWLLAPLELLQQRAYAASKQQRTIFDASLPAEAAVEVRCMAAAIGELVTQLERSQLALAAAAVREQRKDAQALELLKSKLRSSLEASAVAHEIKLPLSQILLNSQLLLNARGNEATLSPALRQQLEAISSAADQMVLTIEQMRTLLRNVQTSHQRLNLAHLCRSALLYLKPALSAADIDIASEGLDVDVPIKGDAAQLQIAIVNVLRNSIEALLLQGQPRRISIALSAEPNAVELRIDDNGPGLPSGLNLLEPLESGRDEGSGLGLFVVQTTLANHRGSIELGHSAALGGASIVLRLPTSG